MLAALNGLLGRQAIRDPEHLRLPDGTEYVRIDRETAFRSSEMPVENKYLDEASQDERKRVAFELLDEETHGFLCIILKPGERPARLVAQVRPEWRRYLSAILSRVIAEYARERVGRVRH